LDAVVGDTLDWSTLAEFENRQTLTDYLYQQVQSLALSNVEPHPTARSSLP
jgi:hypothetical protein